MAWVGSVILVVSRSKRHKVVVTNGRDSRSTYPVYANETIQCLGVSMGHRITEVECPQVLG